MFVLHVVANPRTNPWCFWRPCDSVQSPEDENEWGASPFYPEAPDSTRRIGRFFTPVSASAATQPFAMAGRNANGFSNLRRFDFLVNANASIPAGSRDGFYDQAGNSLFLYDDVHTTVIGPLTPGVAGTMRNSRCAINTGPASVSARGTDLVLNRSTTRQGFSAAGSRDLYIRVTGNANTGTGWIRAGHWTF